MRRLLLSISAFGLLVSPAMALDGYVVKKQVTGATSGQRLEYITETAYKEITPDGKILIMKVEKGKFKFYSLNPQTKTYTDMSFLSPVFVFGIAKFLQCDENMARCREKPDLLIPTGQKVRVGPWTAEKFKLNPSKNTLAGGMQRMMGGEEYVYLTKQAKQLIEAEKMRARFYKNALRSSINIAEALKNYEIAIRTMEKVLDKYGAAVRSDTTTKVPFFGGSRTEIVEVIAVKKTQIPVSEFQVPVGYKAQQMPFQMQVR